MLVIKVELWPFGREDSKQLIAEAKIWNDGTGSPEEGNYEAVFRSDRHGVFEGKLKKHDRSLNVWNLIGRVINAAIPG